MTVDANGAWRSYTNVIYANGVLLVPRYPESDPASLEQAVATYARLLPGWRVKALDVGELHGLGGALHCISNNIDAKKKGPRQ